MAHDRKAGRQSFCTVEFPRPPIIDTVGRNKVGKEALAFTTDFTERDVVEARPGTFDDRSTEFFKEVFVSIGDDADSVWSSETRPTLVNASLRTEKCRYVITTPLNFFPIGISRMSPWRINFFPEHLSGSQWPRSQAAAMKGASAPSGVLSDDQNHEPLNGGFAIGSPSSPLCPPRGLLLYLSRPFEWLLWFFLTILAVWWGFGVKWRGN